MNKEPLLETIEELTKEIKNLKNLNKLLIVGIKNMHDNTFMPLPSLQREAFQKECQSILIAFKMLEYKFNGLKKEDIYDNVMSLTKEELFNV